MGPLSEIILSIRRDKLYHKKVHVTPEELYDSEPFRVKVHFRDKERHFAFDPNILTFEQLTDIVQQAFSLTVPFIVSYVRRPECCKGCSDDSCETFTDSEGPRPLCFLIPDHSNSSVFDSPYYAYDNTNNDYLLGKDMPRKSCKHYHNSLFHDGDLIPILSDYELDGAVLNAADIRLLQLHIEVVEEYCPIFNEEEWDLVEPNGVSDESIFIAHTSITHMSMGYSNSSRPVSQTFRKVSDPPERKEKRRNGKRKMPKKSTEEVVPVSFSWWLTLLDGKGRIQDQTLFRKGVFNNTLQTNFRHIAWKHLLAVYPHNSTFDERKMHLERMKTDYDYLKKEAFRQKLAPSLISLITRDVIRTDRHVAFFNVEFEHPNLQKLYSILYVYAANNYDVEYAQGMSDIAATFVCTMADESAAYACFNKYMEHNKGKFLMNSEVISTCFYQLKRLLKKYDPELYSCLEKTGSQTLLFCYRWFLLDLKREFKLADSLRFLDTYFACVRQPEPGESHFNRVVKDVEHYLVLAGKDSAIIDVYIRAVRSFYCENVRRTFESYRFSFPVYGCFALLTIHRKELMKRETDTITIFFEQMIRQQDIEQVLTIAKSLYLKDIEQQLEKLVTTHHNDFLTTSISDINKQSSWKFI